MNASASLGKDRGICVQPAPRESAQKWQLQDAARKLLPTKKGLQRCCTTRQKGGGGVKIWRYAHGVGFGGLMQCGSVWICPVCAGKVAKGRAKELQKGIDYALATGKGCMMVTLTFSHGRADILADTLDGLSLALRKLKGGRDYKTLMRDFGVFGEVRALEVTHGNANGWHPHTHSITFSRVKLTPQQRFEFECRLFVLWRAACSRAGVGAPVFGPGVHVRTAKDAADYVAKWGFATEVTHSHIKTAKGGGRTPWQLLDASLADDKRAGWLFREYAEAFHGKRQLYYSPGLRQKLGLLEELTDQQLLDLESEERVLVCEIDNDAWSMVLRYRMRAGLLAAADVGAAAVNDFLEGLRERTRAALGSDGRSARRVWIDAVNAGWSS